MVLLICGIVTYVAALQRFGTVDAIGAAIASLGSPLLGALLICAVGALASAFASSAGILGAMMLLAVPFISEGGAAAAGLVVALSISATVVDSCPFSTAGALVVANSEPAERDAVYRGLLMWGAVMVLTAPVLTWLFFVVLAGESKEEGRRLGLNRRPSSAQRQGQSEACAQPQEVTAADYVVHRDVRIGVATPAGRRAAAAPRRRHCRCRRRFRTLSPNLTGREKST